MSSEPDDEVKNSTAAPSVPTRGLRVLVIEDNVDAADAIGELLQLDGYAVAIAYDGLTGLRTATDLEPDVVLCDIGLPGMNGYEVARAFKQDPKLRSSVLVAVSGYGLPRDIAQALAAGFDQHVIKPLDLRRLRGILAAL